MPDTYPYVRLTTLPQRKEPDGLVGFALPHAFTPRSFSGGSEQEQLHGALQAQVRLVSNLWSSGVTAFDLRFVRTEENKGSIVAGLLCRFTRPSTIQPHQFHHYCLQATQRIQRLFADYGYGLTPLPDELSLVRFLSPFRFQAVAEVRRHEEIFVAEDAYTEYEFYVPHPWAYALNTGKRLFSALRQLHGNGMVSMYIEPTQLSAQESSHLHYAASPKVRQLLQRCGPRGDDIHVIYKQFVDTLRQPFLVRIGIAASHSSTVHYLGRTMIDELSANQQTDIAPTLHIPQHQHEWQHANHSLFHLEWVPWGDNKGMALPGTTRLRYLMDAQSASMAFRLPVSFAQASTVVRPTRKVLLVFANPRQEYNLRLSSEDRIIHEAIRLSKFRDDITLTVRHAATIEDLRRTLLDETFQIVHLSGHGTDDGLILEDMQGRSAIVSPDMMARILAAHHKTLQCVIFNACFSAAQGQLIAHYVPFTIAIDGLLNDAAAKEFSRGFYDAIGAGKPYDFAYEEGCRAADLAIPGSSSLTRLMRNTPSNFNE